MIPNTLDRFTTWPSPDCFRCGRNAFVPCTTPQKLMPNSQARSSYDMSEMVAPRPTPALLTTRLARPWSATTRAAWRSTAARSATSSRSLLTRAPRRLGLAARLRKPALVHVGEREHRALARQLERERAADARGRTRHHRNAPAQLSHRVTPARAGGRPRSRRRRSRAPGGGSCRRSRSSSGSHRRQLPGRRARRRAPAGSAPDPCGTATSRG